MIPLEQAEKDILYDLIRTRLATTIAILHWRAAARSGDDPYLGKVLQERSAERFLLRLSALGEEAFCHCVFSAKN